jgi:hypothetical protein
MTSGNAILVSKRYEVSSYSDNGSAVSFTLKDAIDEDLDSWIAGSGTYNPGVSLKIFKEEKINKQEFEGRFFVKIIQNGITDKFIEGQIGREAIERVSGTVNAYYLVDFNGGGSTDYQNTHAGTIDSTSPYADKRSETKDDWPSNFTFEGDNKPHWFIDGCFFRAIQSESSLDPINSKDQGPNYYRGIHTVSHNSFTTADGAGANAWDDNPSFYKMGKTYMNFSFGPVGEDLHDGDQSKRDHGDLNYGSIKKTSNQYSANFDENKHKNQWNTNSPIAKKLTTGNKFQFKDKDGELQDEIYKITNVLVRRTYNYLKWDANYSLGYGGGPQAAIDKYNQKVLTFYVPDRGKKALRQMGLFGKKENRRLTYVCEIERVGEGSSNAMTGTSTFKPLTDGISGATTIDQADNDVSIGIQFTTTFVDEDTNDISINPAIWETEPKDLPELNLYYEASQAYPLSLSADDSERSILLAPIGSAVWCNNPLYDRTRSGQIHSSGICSIDPYTNTTKTLCENDEDDDGNPGEWDDMASLRWQDPVVTKWEGNEVEIYPGLDVDTVGSNWPGAGGSTADKLLGQNNAYVGRILKFYRPDMSFTSAKITGVTEVQTNTTGTMSAHKVRKVTVDVKPTSGLSWSNCFSFANGVESNRIRDDFNKPTISNGVRVSSTIEEPYAEERRESGLIYSGLYNSTNGMNNLNQFIQAEKITKDLNPTYGSIQKLYQRRISLIAFCEDRVVKITAGKDTLYNADGNPQLLATNRVLGDANPFVGDYGISKDPASFAKDSYRAYFTDRQRGAVLRLSMDGLTPISSAGMHDYFKDNLKSALNLIGSYDAKKDNYNLTIDRGGKTYGNRLDEDGNETNLSQTVSYSEDVRGWVSFKSFIPEFGLSMANNYYTFYEGKLHKHDNQTRNRFYQGSGDANSFVETIINESPSTIKNFHTLNYDGDAGWTAIINTDKQSGTVSQFIEKEGKFFNYIKGEDGVIDTAAFNFQGIGTVKTVE